MGGVYIYMRLDRWHPEDVLHEKLGHRIVYDSGSTEGAKLSSVLKDRIASGCEYWGSVINLFGLLLRKILRNLECYPSEVAKCYIVVFDI